VARAPDETIQRQMRELDPLVLRSLEQSQRNEVRDHHVGGASIELELLGQTHEGDELALEQPREQVKLGDRHDQQIRRLHAIPEPVKHRRIRRGHARILHQPSRPAAVKPGRRPHDAPGADHGSY